MGGATFAPGKVEQAFLLDGNDDFVDAGNAPNLHVSEGDFTVDAWVKFNSLCGSFDCDQAIVDKMVGNTAYNDDGWRLLKQRDHRFWFCLGGGPGVDGCISNSVQSTTLAKPGVWFHVAGVKTSNSISIYVNGVLEGTKSFVDFTDTHSTNLLIGRTPQDLGFVLNGLVDEVEIYNRALSTTEIQAIFSADSKGKCKVATVAIDIKPGSFPNSINPRSKGVIPVAILTDTFDATTVDPLSVEFGPTGATESHGRGHIEDVDGDGDQDLVLHFRTQDTGIQCGDISAPLTGKTFDGAAIQGSDSIRTVGCK